tara:strand:+ start:267 stop:482 length:216 start_codon:yes stop_codon:yes gene_type:complete
MKYTHYFDVQLAQQFDSDIPDFDEAFEEWAKGFKDSLTLREALLDSDESTRSLCQGIIWSETDPDPDEDED